MKLGLDIGSTTIKTVLLDSSENIVYKSYDRHFSCITEKAAEALRYVAGLLPAGEPVSLCISGSAGMGLAEGCGIPFLQEVYSTRAAASRVAPDADVIIELGGEDAKILFLTGGTEVRMNGSCAGGTGAFIDQMASLLQVTPGELDSLASKSERIYPIASRCGVFAKSDIQPLLNQGAHKEDVAASILNAVVGQTVTGLAQGRRIRGNVYYLGGPLTFFPELRASFDRTLKLTGVCPENSLFFVALGAAYQAEKPQDLLLCADRLAAYQPSSERLTLPPLFKNRQEYDSFLARHRRAQVPKASYRPGTPAFLGIDAGSTTVKTVLINEDGALLDQCYLPTNGNPVLLVREYLAQMYARFPGIRIAASAVTGYGEDLIRNAFSADFGVVETMAHLTSARYFAPDTDFVIDIGGQDIKCFKIKNDSIDSIFLNEACSSGCGSFLQTFAGAMGKSIEEFASLGLFADHPVELGSRCTVFMNSSVKQAQKDGASAENISAGLSISVVKNALYKVIRATSKEDLGQHIVVQGGTFLNDAVLRAFEKELGCHVVRPEISGLMGAYGAALHALSRREEAAGSLADAQAIAAFTHEEKQAVCHLCGNHCRLSINIFGGKNRFISGNRCERALGKGGGDLSLDLYEYKRSILQGFMADTEAPMPTGEIGLPMGLNFYDLLPFWTTFFRALGIRPVVSGLTDTEISVLGQESIPSDTVCYPAKLMHGHIQKLLNMGVKKIFYPCMTYNLNEKRMDNHYNCPVVAYYPEVIHANMDMGDGELMFDYLMVGANRRFPAVMAELLNKHGFSVTRKQIQAAVREGFIAESRYRDQVFRKGIEIMRTAREQGRRIILLAGRPYHVDPIISHGIDRLIVSLGAAVVTEDTVAGFMPSSPVNVLNQWTYHARMYRAADFVCQQPDVELVQLVSFGCGVDAITGDEIRSILERSGKLYTQIKIDEITNLGAVKIRLRSLLAAAEQREFSPQTSPELADFLKSLLPQPPSFPTLYRDSHARKPGAL